MTGPAAPLPADDPRMIAWVKYTTTAKYVDCMKWALDTNAPGDRRQRYVDGALWMAFVTGFDAADAAARDDDDDNVRAETLDRLKKDTVRLRKDAVRLRKDADRLRGEL